MIEQGDYMVTNLARRIRDLPRIQQSASSNLDMVSGGQFQPKHIARWYLLQFLDLKRSLNIRILYLNEKVEEPSTHHLLFFLPTALRLLPARLASETTLALLL